MAKSLIGSLPYYAQHLAEQTGVKVVVQGTRAFTDGKTVTVPFSEDDLPLSFGFIAHECSHVRNTDMAVFGAAAPVPFRKNLLNILEDIRIERLSMDQYPGTEDDIRYLNRKVLLDPFQPERVAQATDVEIIHNAILMGGYWKLQEPQLEVPARAYLEALEARLGQELADKIMAEVLKTLKCDSTKEVLALVDSIIELLPSSEDKPESEPEKGNDEGADESGEKGESEADPQGEGEGETGNTDSDGTGEKGSDPSGEQNSSQGDEAGGDQPANGGEDGTGGGQPNSEQKSSPEGQGASSDQKASGQRDATQQPGDGQDAQLGLRERVMQATESDLQGLISEVGDAAAELLGRKASASFNPIKPFPLGGRAVRRSDEASCRRRTTGEAHSAGLRQILNGLLQAQVDCRVRLKRQGRRIDTSRIAMLPAGETRVFRSKARAERQSAAIQFLFDKSVSMDAAMEQAEAALYAVLRGLEGLPLVTTGAMSFPGTTTAGADQCCDLIKRSTERLGAAVEAGGFGALPHGGTPLAQAIWPAAIEVLRAKGERKILFVITDGEPNSGTDGYCKEMFERCEASGIQVIGLGFGSANSYVLSKLFTKYVAVGTVSRLKTALFEVVRDVLTA